MAMVTTTVGRSKTANSMGVVRDHCGLSVFGTVALSMALFLYFFSKAYTAFEKAAIKDRKAAKTASPHGVLAISLRFWVFRLRTSLLTGFFE